jgi:hypothetical protein
MVPRIVSDAVRSPTAATDPGVATNHNIAARAGSPTVVLSQVDSMTDIRKRYQAAGLSSEVIKILLSSWSQFQHL